MGTCPECGNKGYFTVSMQDFKGYSTCTPPIACDCGHGKQWLAKGNKDAARQFAEAIVDLAQSTSR